MSEDINERQALGNHLVSRVAVAPAVNSIYARFAAFIPAEAISTDVPWPDWVPGPIKNNIRYLPPYRFIGGDQYQRYQNGRWRGLGYHFVEAGIDDHSRGSISVAGYIDSGGSLQLSPTTPDGRYIAFTHRGATKTTGGTVKGYRDGSSKILGPESSGSMYWRVDHSQFYYPDEADDTDQSGLTARVLNGRRGVQKLELKLTITNDLTLQPPQIPDWVPGGAAVGALRSLLRMLKGDITAHATLEFRTQGGRITGYRFSGAHDGFPAYELYLGTAEDSSVAQRIHAYNPRTSGATAFNLMGTPDVQFERDEWLNWPPGTGVARAA